MMRTVVLAPHFAAQPTQNMDEPAVLMKEGKLNAKSHGLKKRWKMGTAEPGQAENVAWTS
jgi:hypothetical protein